MTNEDPAEGRCNAQTRDGNYCANHPVEGADRCRMHGGTNPGAPEHNQNGAEHYGYSMAEHFQKHLKDWEQERVSELLADYVEKVAPFGWDDPRVDRLELICVKIIQEWRVELQMLEEGMTEQIVVGTDDDGNPTATNNEGHHLRRPSHELSGEVRSGLKDLSCLGSPEEDFAGAAQEVAAMWKDDLTAED